MPPTFNECWPATLMPTPHWWIGTMTGARAMRFECWETATTRRMRYKQPFCAPTGRSIGIKNAIDSVRGCIEFS